jgi:hypothetical protein
MGHWASVAFGLIYVIISLHYLGSCIGILYLTFLSQNPNCSLDSTTQRVGKRPQT